MSSKRAVWRDRLEAWRESGESVAGYCRSRGLSRAQFEYWQRMLRNTDATRDEALSFVPVLVNADGVPSAAGRGVIEVRLPRGVCVAMPSDQAVSDALVLIRGLLAC